MMLWKVSVRRVAGAVGIREMVVRDDIAAKPGDSPRGLPNRRASPQPTMGQQQNGDNSGNGCSLALSSGFSFFRKMALRLPR